MSEPEKAYLSKVKATMASGKNPIETVEELAKLAIPKRDEMSLNTVYVSSNIDYLDFTRFDGDLDNNNLTDEEYDKIENETAEGILKRIKKIIVDLESGNIYKERFEISLVYSNLKGNDYTYLTIDKPLKVGTRAEAEKIRDELKQSTPKEHPDKPEYALERIGLGTEVIDTHGEVQRLWA